MTWRNLRACSGPCLWVTARWQDVVLEQRLIRAPGALVLSDIAPYAASGEPASELARISADADARVIDGQRARALARGERVTLTRGPVTIEIEHGVDAIDALEWVGPDRRFVACLLLSAALVAGTLALSLLWSLQPRTAPEALVSHALVLHPDESDGRFDMGLEGRKPGTTRVGGGGEGHLDVREPYGVERPLSGREPQPPRNPPLKTALMFSSFFTHGAGSDEWTGPRGADAATADREARTQDDGSARDPVDLEAVAPPVRAGADPISTFRHESSPESLMRVRAFLVRGVYVDELGAKSRRPPRAQDLLNYFDYRYADGFDAGSGPLATQLAAAPSPYDAEHHILRVAIHAKATLHEARIQVEFQRHMVARYRLIGYERSLQRAYDPIRGADLLAGQVVTAIYDVELVSGLFRHRPWASARVRYRPDRASLTEIEFRLSAMASYATFADALDDFRFATAVAGVAERLWDSPYAESWRLDDIERIARASHSSVGHGAELLAAIERMR
jgi:hypothetical protein